MEEFEIPQTLTNYNPEKKNNKKKKKEKPKTTQCCRNIIGELNREHQLVG